MTNQIPATYYKQAAEIMSDLPDVDFMNIVAVLYAHETWIERQNALTKATPEQPAAEEPKAAKNRRMGRKLPVRATIDGKVYIAPNRYDLLSQIGIQEAYDGLYHCGKRREVREEAELFAKKAKSMLGVTVTDYTSYGFDGACHRVRLDNGIFQAEEVK